MVSFGGHKPHVRYICKHSALCMTKQYLSFQCLRAGSPLPLRARLSHEKKKFLHVVLAFSYARTRGCSTKLLFLSPSPPLDPSFSPQPFCQIFTPLFEHGEARSGLLASGLRLQPNQTEQPPRRGVATPPPFSSRLENSKVPSPLRTCVQGKKKGVGEVMNLHKRGWGRKEGE